MDGTKAQKFPIKNPLSRPASPRRVCGTGKWVFFFFLTPYLLFASLPPAFLSGNAAYNQGLYPQAEDFYLQACRQDPEEPGPFYGAALCEYLLKNYPAAKDNIEKALKLDPRLQVAQQLLERIKKKLDGQQIRDLQCLLLTQEGVLDFRAHQYEKASVVFEKAVALNPLSAELHFNLGLAYLKQKAWDKAERELKQCLKLKPDDPRAQYALGVLYQNIGGVTEAQNYFLAVAQAPNAVIFNMQAMQRLATMRTENASSPFHFSLRLQGGGGQSTLEETPTTPGSPPQTSSGTNQYGHLQLGFSPLIGQTPLNFSYAWDGSLSQSPTSPTRFYQWHGLSVGSQPHLPANWSLPLSFDEQIGLDPGGNLFYQHHLATMGLQWLFLHADVLQFQVQYLRENFLPPVSVNTSNWTGSISASFILGSSHFIGLSYSYRQCLSDTLQTNYYDYGLNSLSLTYHIELGGGWSASANYTPQWQEYPYFYDANNNPRSDWIQNASLEAVVPLIPHWNFVLGDQFQQIQSSISSYSLHSNNYYLATQVFF